MSVLSKKVFYNSVDDVGCDVFHIWEPDCIRANFSPVWLGNLFVGSGKFLFRIYLIKLFLNCRRKDVKTAIKTFLLDQFRSTIFGGTMGFLLCASMCIIRKLTSRMNYYQLLFLPGCVSGLSLLVESAKNQVLHRLLYFNLFVETLIRKSKLNEVWQTIMFMGISGSLMHILTNRNDKIDFTHFWFYIPPMRESNDEIDGNTCAHEKTCVVHTYKGLLKYFLLGYGANALKRIIPRMEKLMRDPSILLDVIVSKKNFYFGLFIGSYVGLYRVLTCYLKRTSQIGNKFHGLMAGIISGITYAISPNIHVLVIAITTLAQVVYNRIRKHFRITNNFWQRQLLFMLCHGFLMHENFCYRSTCAPYYVKMIDACTNNVTSDVYKNLKNKFMMT
ncbi:hypothetical protein JTB14_025459 [Gonioctena quinquepunctata]|nr:hypothetical protein JTB14_025459 [Gonioctena quinquepunctata]